MTSYQKLKKENELLKRQLNELVINPYSIESCAIRMGVSLKHQTEDVIMFGEHGVGNFKFNGILSQVNNNPH